MRNQKGMTLIELIITMGMIGIVSVLILSYIKFSFLSIKDLENKIEAQQNTRMATHYILSELKKHKNITIYSKPEGVILMNEKGEYVLDLRNKLAGNKKTYLYFNQNTMQLRTNKEGEHNPLVDNIKNVFITKEKDVISIKVIAKSSTLKKEISITSKIYIKNEVI